VHAPRAHRQIGVRASAAVPGARPQRTPAVSSPATAARLRNRA
jgi:hypothetical protein